MPTAQWPLVKAWLVDTIPTLTGLSGWAVYSGPVAGRAAPKRYVSVGFVEDDNGGTFTRGPVYDGTAWSEVGEVRTRITAQSGDSAGSVAEADAFAAVDAIDEKVRDDWTLGGLLSAEAEIQTSIDVLSISNARGTATELVHVLRYTTTT